MRPLFVASATLASLALAASIPALAQQVQGYRSAIQGPAPSYVCKMLPLTPEQLRDPGALPPVLATPGGAVIGHATGIVYALAPEHVVGGYLEVIQYNGHPGWVQAARLVPYASRSDPHAACPPPPWASAVR